MGERAKLAWGGRTSRSFLGVGELEERQRAAVPQLENRVAIDALGAKQLVDLTPRGDDGNR